jgi:anthranilate synthase component 2
MNVLLIDNFDSFTYNLYQYLGEISEQVTVVRNTKIPMDEIEAGKFSHIVISPGPGNPTDRRYFGGCEEVIKRFYQHYPILGVCLGHQGIGAAFGAEIIRAPVVMHGKTSTFGHTRAGILRGLPSDITVMRYHSLVIDPANVPSELVIDATADDGAIMAFHHQDYPVFGLQFHPESFGTETGKAILSNFIGYNKDNYE